MKTSILVGTAVVLAGMFQKPATPIMKMGLWDMNIQMKMNIPDMPAAMAGLANRNIHMQNCVTPESYEKAFNSFSQQKACARSNETWTAKGYSFDQSCNEGKTTSHTDMIFDSPSAAHGTVHSETAGKRGATTSDAIITMSYIGESCGDVTPEKPKMIH